MTDSVDNRVLEHLKRFQSGQDRVESKLEEVVRRLSNLETGHASMIQHFGRLAAADAQQQMASNNFSSRFERIERQLERQN